MRNIDIFRSFASKFVGNTDLFDDILNSIPKIRMQQASDYWKQVGTVSSQDIPNIAPPWDSFYFEYSTSGGSVAGMFQSDKRPDGGWDALATFAVIVFGEVVSLSSIDFKINSDGSRNDKEGFDYHNFYSVPYTCTKNEMEDGLYVTLTPMFLGLCFCHCDKQVEMKTEEVPAKLLQRHINENRVPVERWHILNIEPVKRLLDSVRKAKNTGIKMALHLCRGHFANYKDGKGLFGKYHGVYWMPPTLKGSSAYGKVNKEYQVSI